MTLQVEVEIGRMGYIAVNDGPGGTVSAPVGVRMPRKQPTVHHIS